MSPPTCVSVDMERMWYSDDCFNNYPFVCAISNDDNMITTSSLSTIISTISSNTTGPTFAPPFSLCGRTSTVSYLTTTTTPYDPISCMNDGILITAPDGTSTYIILKLPIKFFSC